MVAKNPPKFKSMITPEAQSILDTFGFEHVGTNKNQRDQHLFMATTPTQDVVISLPINAGKEDLLEAIVASGRAQQRQAVRDAHQGWLNTFKG